MTHCPRFFPPRLAVSLLAAIGLVAAPVAAAPFRGEPVGATMPPGNRKGNPTIEMQPGQRLISSFGERPAFSPDGRKLAFIGESYSDAFEVDLASGAIRNLTSHMAHKGFVRVQYLGDGSFILIGPHVPGPTRIATRGRNELFWLDARASRPAVRLNAPVIEGVATSRRSNQIAWAPLPPIAPGAPLPTTSSLNVATVVVADGSARLADARTVVSPPGCMVEGQDFFDDDRAMTFPCYRLATGNRRLGTEVMSVDIASGRITTYPTPPSLYAEVEGIFPDGKRTLVECSGEHGAGMDICMLELKPQRPAYTRLTRIMDYGRWKYSNPVVNPNGRMIATSVGSADVEEAGVGQGIIVIDLPEGF